MSDAIFRVLGPTKTAQAGKGECSMKVSHMIWARVSADREQLLPLAPQDYEPIVEVFLHGRAEPIVPAYVETRNDGWVRIQATSDTPGDEEGKWHYADSHSHERNRSSGDPLPQDAPERTDRLQLRRGRRVADTPPLTSPAGGAGSVSRGGRCQLRRRRVRNG